MTACSAKSRRGLVFSPAQAVTCADTELRKESYCWKQRWEVSLDHLALVRSLPNQLPAMTAAVLSYQSEYLMGLHPVRCVQRFTIKQKIKSLHLGYYASTFLAKQLYLPHVLVYGFWRIWKKCREGWWRREGTYSSLVCALLPHCLFLEKWMCWWYSLTFLSSHVSSSKCV